MAQRFMAQREARWQSVVLALPRPFAITANVAFRREVFEHVGPFDPIFVTAEDVDVGVDMLEMLPTPWGLVRSGVAPDHPKIKSISKQFEKTAEDPRFRFFGNVVVGEHVEPAELAERYDAVIYAIGTQSDRSLNIPGEELRGSVAAVDFVGWYNAHPHFEHATPDLSGARAVVVGGAGLAAALCRSSGG